MKTMDSPKASFLESLVSNAKKSSSTANSIAKSAAKRASDSMAASVSTVASSVSSMQKVNCPTCGSSAERHRSSSDSLVRTQCDRCDYLMVFCSKTGRVIESYAPSFSPTALVG